MGSIESTKRQGLGAGLLSWVPMVGILLLCWFFSYGLLQQGDVLQSEFGGHPDEASHYVTGLMVFDYLHGHLGEHPLRFATDYYDYYPKVAIGHFPPFFYIVQAIWFSIFSDSVTGVFLLQSFTAALLAALIGWTVTLVGPGRFWGVAASLVFCSLPLVQRYVGMVMSDLLLGLFCFLSCLVYARFLGQPSYGKSLLFGCLASMTIMIKGSGLMLAFVPPLSLILLRRYELFKSKRFWVAVVPVILVCLPWMLLTYKITEEGMVREWSLGYVAEALPYFAVQGYRTFGFALLALLAAGVGGALRGRVAVGRCPELTAVMLALPIGLGLTYTLLPVGFEQRYLIPALGPAMVFIALGGFRFRDILVRRKQSWKASGLAALVLLGCYLIEVFEIPRKHFNGFQTLIERIDFPKEGDGTKVLISSDARGEGVVVANVAMRDERPETRVLRGSKVLSTSDWMGRGYRLTYETAADLIEFLDSDGVDWIIVDQSLPESRITGHHEQLIEVLATDSERFRLVERTEIHRRYEGLGKEASLYRFVSSDAGGRIE